MDTTALINTDNHPVTLKDNMKRVCTLFEQTTLSHVPVIQNGMLMGNISEEDCKSFDHEKTLEDYQYLYNSFFVKKNSSWLNILEAFAQNESNIMPVLDEENLYIGYYELADILTIFNETPFMNEHGGTLVIEKNLKDNSFSEIAQIVESNNGKLLGAFVSDIRDNIIQITLKIANTGINEIIQTFRRYNYEIITGADEDTYLQELKERSEYLQKYLNI